jgi:hypothetical protein
VAPGRHRLAFAGGALEVTVAAGTSVNAQVPLTYAEQLLGDAAEAMLRHDLGRTQQLLNRARVLLERGHGAPGTQGELRLLQARIFDAQGRWEEAMQELQVLFKLSAGQRKPEQLAAAQALQSRLGMRLGRIRVYKEGDGRCLLSEDWVRPGEHVIDEGGGHARVVRVREGATVEVNLCQGAPSR